MFHAFGNNPIKYVDPDGRAPTDMEAAYIAQDVYDYSAGEAANLIGGWQRDSIHYLANGESGGCIGVYSRTDSTGRTEYVLANKGTNPFFINDWRENIAQVFGNSKDMKMSINIATNFVKKHPGADITFTGHSKGGAEATANAVATNKNAVIFNPATANLQAYDLYQEKYKGSMMAYIVEGEVLNELFGSFSMPVDKMTFLPAPFYQESWALEVPLTTTLWIQSLKQ